MGKLFKKLKAGFEDAIAYEQGKIELRTEVIEVSETPVVEKPMKTKSFQKYIEKRFTREELAQIEAKADLEVKILKSI